MPENNTFLPQSCQILLEDGKKKATALLSDSQ
jgi:hypothetical protein